MLDFLLYSCYNFKVIYQECFSATGVPFVMIFLWIALYGIAHSAGDWLTRYCGAADWTYAAVMLLYAVLFVLWTVGKTDIRITVHGFRPGDFAVCLPLLILPVFNLLAGGFRMPDWTDVLVMLSVAVTEELFFRGWLLSFFRKKGCSSAVLATSILFALLHAVNGFENPDGGYILLQILCAFAVSICLCETAIRFDSILPCAAAHFLTNIIGSGSIAGRGQILGLLVCIVLYICFGLLLSSYGKKNSKERVS